MSGHVSRLIGMLGGMSWESTATYYRLLNEGVRARLDGLHSARILLHSVDFADIELLQSEGRWQDAGAQLAEMARQLENAGAECIVIATNTMHRVANQVEAAVSIPLLHIADQTGKRLHKNAVSKVGLLGTRFTMEETFYRGRIEEQFGIEVVIPAADQRTQVHDIIYRELVRGVISDKSREVYRAVMQGLVSQGAEAIILGCTEIGLLVGPEDAAVDLYDTTAIHCEAALRFALAPSQAV